MTVRGVGGVLEEMVRNGSETGKTNAGTKYERLRFRRQYFISNSKEETFPDWQYVSLGPLHIYAHPDVELSMAGRPDRKLTMGLVGYFIDPNHPASSNFQILSGILESMESVDDIPRYLHALGGRFVLVVSTPRDTFIFNDPCGLRPVYYTRYHERIYLGAQPLIFELVMPLQTADSLVAYQNSHYKRSKIGHWIPSGCSLYENIHHLVPNHYLRLSDLVQVRYWPSRRLEIAEWEEVSARAAILLQRLIETANRRFKLALPLTAGQDSRILLSATKNIAAEVFFYTLQYRDLTRTSVDIRIPRALLARLGYEHQIIDCRVEMDDEFGEVYENNTALHHKHDWGHIAYGMLNRYPKDRVCVKGNCSEICRCFYYKSGKHAWIESAQQLISLERGWDELAFVGRQISDWFPPANAIARETGVDILDLFYWEHRMGSWQAQSQLEWDIIQEVYTPFNHRHLLEMMLAVPSKFRCAPQYHLYRGMGIYLWPEVLTEPINPPVKMKDRIKDLLLRVGLEGIARRAYRTVTEAIGWATSRLGYNKRV